MAKVQDLSFSSRMPESSNVSFYYVHVTKTGRKLKIEVAAKYRTQIHTSDPDWAEYDMDKQEFIHAALSYENCVINALKDAGISVEQLIAALYVLNPKEK